MRRVGGGWINTSKKTGKKYISVKMEDDSKLIIYKNDRKEKETQPDYNIYDPNQEAEQTTKKQWKSETDYEEIPF